MKTMPGRRAGLGDEVGVLGQEAVAGMDRLRAACACAAAMIAVAAR